MYQIVEVNGKYGILDIKTNTTIIPYVFESMKWCGKCLCLKLNGKWGVLPMDKLQTLSV